MLISKEYAAENQRQHEMRNGYGERGHKHLPAVIQLAQREHCATALDYGCGQGSLAAKAKKISPLLFSNYDPAIPEFAALPSPADLVVCTDVLEHIEMTCLMNVVEHLASLVNKAFYFNIATRPAGRMLSDGRNAHLIIRDPYFWFDTLRPFFDITEMSVIRGHSVGFVGTRLGGTYQ